VRQYTVLGIKRKARRYRRAKFLPRVDAMKALNEEFVIIARDNFVPLPTAQNKTVRGKLTLFEADSPTTSGVSNIDNDRLGLVVVFRFHGFLRYLMVGVSLPSNREDSFYAIISDRRLRTAASVIFDDSWIPPLVRHRDAVCIQP